jgi:hypothetical protein
MKFNYRKYLNKQTGQAIIIALALSVLLISFVSYTFYVGYGSYEKINLQNAADAGAYSGAVIEAKVLNCVAALNSGIIFITNLVTTIVLIWLLVKACAALCFIGIGCKCVPVLAYFEKYGKPLLNKLKDLAWAMAKMQDFIINWAKYYLIPEITRIAKLNNANIRFIYPYNVAGSLGVKSTLDFYLIRANKKEALKKSGYSDESVKIASGESDDVMSCYNKKWNSYEYNEALSYGFKHPGRVIYWFYKLNGNIIQFEEPKGMEFSTGDGDKKYTFDYAQTTECKKVSEILTKGYKLPSPLVLRDDFKERQKLFIAVSSKPFDEKQFLDKGYTFNDSFLAFSQARPEGSSILDMEWTAKLEPCTLQKDMYSESKIKTLTFLGFDFPFYKDLVNQ